MSSSILNSTLLRWGLASIGIAAFGALCAGAARAQDGQPCTADARASYVVVRQGVTHCGAVTRAADFARSRRILVGDTLRLRLVEVIELQQGGRYYRRTANGRHMAERISTGRLDLYRRLYTPATMTPGGLAYNARVLDVPSNRIDYVARPGEAPQEATYSVVLALVRDNPESMRALNAYRTRSQIGFWLSMGGIALMGVGAAATDLEREDPRVSSFLVVGAVVSVASPFVFRGRSGDLRRAMEAYDR